MHPPEKIIVIGAGQAGCELCTELRRQGYAGSILLLGEESWPPYKRPPLSKDYLSGKIAEEALYVLPEAQMLRHDITFRGNTRVVRILPAEQKIELANGEVLTYDGLALTTGGRARTLPVAGADLGNVQVLRTLDHVRSMRAEFQPGRRLVIVGGGFIGLEAAAVAVKMGLQVTVLEGLDRVLARVTAPQVSSFYERAHREAGVDLRMNAQVSALSGNGTVDTVHLQDGSTLPADFVLVGIGLIANVELAAEAGLTVDNGIVVDEQARTNDPHIVAAGDCTSHPSEYAGRHLRLESVQNALEQARVAARTLLGVESRYQTVPWFWSDQYDLKLQIVGLSTGYDQIILRGDPTQVRNFSAFYLRAGRIIAADIVNRPLEFMLAKKLVASAAEPDLALLADDNTPLKTLLL